MTVSELRIETSARVKRDVAVIGGGPAGSAAALVLARGGRDVVLFERSRGAPPKLCGEFLSARGVRALERIGAIDAVRSGGAIEVSSWSVASARREFRRRFARPGLAISRSALDPTLRALSQSQGADVIEGARVASVEWSARGAAQLTIAEGVPGEVTARGPRCRA
jgi:flavin-dependent dehydrogenase